MKFQLTWTSNYKRKENIELTTLEELIDLVDKEGRIIVSYDNNQLTEDLSNLLADMQRRYREIDAELAEVEFVFANIRDTLTKLNSAFLTKKES